MICKENAEGNANFQSKEMVILLKGIFNTSKRMLIKINAAAIVLNNLSCHKEWIYSSDAEAVLIRCINLSVKLAEVSSIRPCCNNSFKSLSSFIRT